MGLTKEERLAYHKTYGGKLHLKRTARLEEMEGWRHKGYIPKDKNGNLSGGSGITIGFGIDLSQISTVDDLVSYGIERATAEKWEKLNVFGKNYNQLKKEGINVNKTLLKVNIPNTPNQKSDISIGIGKEVDAKLTKYQGKISDDAYIALASSVHFGGGLGVDKSSNKGVSRDKPDGTIEVDKGGINSYYALDRKAHAQFKIFNEIDKWIEENPDGVMPDEMIHKVYQQNSEDLKKSGSPLNATTYDRDGDKFYKDFSARQKTAENEIAQKESSKKVSNIKNKDNLDYLERRANAGAVELSDEDNTIIQNIAEEQRIQWSKLGKPGILDLAKNALGMSQGDISVDDDAANAVMRRQVINSLSEDIDINTASGKQLLRQRIKAYTDLIGSDEYKEKVETLTGGGIDDSTYENMIDDLSSDYQVFIVDANKIHNLEGKDAINYEIKSQEHLDKNLDNEGVLSDNKATIQNLIADGNKDLANDVAERGLDAVAVDLANAQNEAAKRGETDATAKTLLALADKEAEMAVEKKSMDEGVAGLEAIDFGEVDEDEEEITTTFDEWKKNNPDGTLEDWQKEQKNTKNTSNNKAKISGAEKVLTGLKAAAGILSLSQALRAPDVETPEISPLVTEALHKQKALAESGLTAKEKGAAMQNLNDAYAGAMKNVLRASGGQRGMFLANQGTVDANRIQGLNQLAAQDAALHRQNIGQYNQLASSVGSMKLSRDMNVEQMRQATLNNNRQILSGVGSNLLSDAISDVSYYMNPNREKTQALFDQLSKGQNADTSGFDSLVETANTDSKNQKQVDKDQVANQKKIKG